MARLGFLEMKALNSSSETDLRNGHSHLFDKWLGEKRVMLDYSKIFFLFWLENLPSSQTTCWKNTNLLSKTDDSHDHEKKDDIDNVHVDDEDADDDGDGDIDADIDANIDADINGAFDGDDNVELFTNQTSSFPQIETRSSWKNRLVLK